jgi:hypothetical protein
MVIEFTCLHQPGFHVAPFDVALEISPDGVAHEVSLFTVSITTCGSGVLAKGRFLPWPFRVFNEWHEANAFNPLGFLELANFG